MIKGKNVNIYIRGSMIDKTKKLIESHKFSHLIDKLLKEYFEKEELIMRREYELELEQAYQDISKDKKFQEEKSLWNELDNDNIWKH